MDFSDLINGNSAENRVQPLKINNTPHVLGKNCRKCGQYYKQDMYLPSLSWFFPDGYIDICNSCLDKYLGDCMDIDKADKLCQYMDIPFDLNSWMTIVNSNGRGSLYCTRNFRKNRKPVLRKIFFIIKFDYGKCTYRSDFRRSISTGKNNSHKGKD